MSETPAVGKDASQFVSLSSFQLSSKVQLCYREEFERCQIHPMDKICLELARFEKFATAVLQTVAKRCSSSRDHFSESAAKTNGA